MNGIQLPDAKIRFRLTMDESKSKSMRGPKFTLSSINFGKLLPKWRFVRSWTFKWSSFNSGRYFRTTLSTPQFEIRMTSICGGNTSNITSWMLLKLKSTLTKKCNLRKIDGMHRNLLCCTCIVWIWSIWAMLESKAEKELQAKLMDSTLDAT